MFKCERHFGHPSSSSPRAASPNHIGQGLSLLHPFSEANFVPLLQKKTLLQLVLRLQSHLAALGEEILKWKYIQSDCLPIKLPIHLPNYPPIPMRLMWSSMQASRTVVAPNADVPAKASCATPWGTNVMEVRLSRWQPIRLVAGQDWKQ